MTFDCAKKILVIDDEFDIADVIADMILETPGRQVFNANTPSEAYMRSISTKFDLIVTDFRMPKTDGVDLFKAIRGQKLNHSTPVIVVSGYKEEALQKMGSVGNVTVIGKPFQTEDLRKIVDMILNNPHLQAEPKSQFDIQILNELFMAAEVLMTAWGLAPFQVEKPQLYKVGLAVEAKEACVVHLTGTGFIGSSFVVAFPAATIDKMAATGPEHLPLSFVQAMFDHARIVLGAKEIRLNESRAQAWPLKNGKVLPPEPQSRTLVVGFDSGAGPFSILASVS